MKSARLPLLTKVLFVAFVNLCLLGLALAVIMRAQFRLDSGSFLLAPAQSRIMTVAQQIALELEEARRDSWDDVLRRHGQAHHVQFELIDEFGERVAGSDLRLPHEVSERIPRRTRRGDDRPPPNEDRKRGEPGPEDGEPRPDRAEPTHRPAPPLFLTATTDPPGYWAGARIPVRENLRENPHPDTLLIMAPSLLASPLFFDVAPWVTIGLAVIVISIACWLPFIRGLTRSISQLTHAAGQIAAGRFEVHVADHRRDEIGQLGGAVNRMAGRLSTFVNGQKVFLSGIAHELCNPIATIQFGLGNLERKIEEPHREAVAEIQEEVQHMSALVNELLQFSRGGIEALDLKLRPVNVSNTVRRVLDREAAEGVDIQTSVDSGLYVVAEPEYLFRALSNVVRNAIRYAGHAGPISISVERESGRILIATADCGPGVPEQHLDAIFAPFYRLDASRNRETGGMGLGLAIVKTCVESCGGVVSCRSRQPSGLVVEMRLQEAPKQD